MKQIPKIKYVSSSVKIAALRRDLETVTLRLLTRIEHMERRLLELDGQDIKFRVNKSRRSDAE